MWKSITQYFNQLAFSVTSIAVVVIAWVLFFSINHVFLTGLDHNPNISYLFLPSAVRLLAVLVFEINGVIGLFIGALLTNAHKGFDFQGAVDLSLISAVNPYIAVTLTQYFMKMKVDLQGLTTGQLVLLSLMSALMNTCTHNVYYYLHGLSHDLLKEMSSMFIGDFFGAMLVLYLVSFFLLRRRQSA